MSPKVRPNDPFPHGKPNQDLLQNLSFLYQANVYIQSLSAHTNRLVDIAGPSTPRTIKFQGHKVSLPRSNHCDIDLPAVARRANKGYDTAAKHSMLKTDPGLKRSFCSTCNTILVAGVTCRVRIKPGRKIPQKTTTTCTQCAKAISIPTPPRPDHPSNDVLTQAEQQNRGKPRGLDGPVRHRRKQKIARETPFWQDDRHMIVPIKPSYMSMPAATLTDPTGALPTKIIDKRVKNKGDETKALSASSQKGKKKARAPDIGTDSDLVPGSRPARSREELPVSRLPSKKIQDMDEEEMMNFG